MKRHSGQYARKVDAGEMHVDFMKFTTQDILFCKVVGHG